MKSHFEVRKLFLSIYREKCNDNCNGDILDGTNVLDSGVILGGGGVLGGRVILGGEGVLFG